MRGVAEDWTAVPHHLLPAVPRQRGTVLNHLATLGQGHALIDLSFCGCGAQLGGRFLADRDGMS